MHTWFLFHSTFRFLLQVHFHMQSKEPILDNVFNITNTFYLVFKGIPGFPGGSCGAHAIANANMCVNHITPYYNLLPHETVLRFKV